jgi:hypothetical protein
LLIPPIDAYSALVPLDALPALEREIEATLKPAHRREVSMAVATLGAWLKIPSTIACPEQFGKAMEDELVACRYPADVLNEAVLQARRQLDWYPSIKEMIAICEQLIKPRRLRDLAIGQMKAEHARRQQESASAPEEEARRRAEIKWLRVLEERARQRFGNNAPLPGDIELANSISKPRVSCGRSISWSAALERGELWAAQYCRLMALAERTRQAIRQGRIDWDECLQIGKLISRDEAAARSAVAEAEAREARPQYEFPSPDSFWDALWRIHKACGLDVPRSKDPDAVPTAIENAKHLAALAGLADVREIDDRPMLEEWVRQRRQRGTLMPD